MVPMWLLGWNQSRYGYKDTAALEAVVSNYKKAGIPLDTMWSDIDYLSSYEDFTIDQTNYSGLGKFVTFLHGQGQHYIPIIDAGIASIPGGDYQIYNDGIKDGVFLSDYTGKAPFVGRVWPGDAVFIDWSHPKAHTFWQQGIAMLAAQVDFDGIWLDMNEPANFCKNETGYPIGECPLDITKSGKEWKGVERSLNKKPRRFSPVQKDEFSEIPYVPTGETIDYKTISADGFMFDENDNGTFLMYNVHNIYGTLEAMETSSWLEQKDGRRPLVISRDSFVGHGMYGSVWTGDNVATENQMKLSINQIMNFNMFGMPFVGSDICGFANSTTPELCARWAQVGSFYPFMRNHYAIDKDRQEFWRFDQKYQVGMKASIRQRYSLLRYMYTCLYKSHRLGDPTIRHPMFEWPDIDEMVNNEDSFLIGNHVRITANFDTDPNPADFKSFFPKGKWVDYNTYNYTVVEDTVEELKLYEGFKYTNIHIKEGSIIPFQDASEESGVKHTHDLLERQMKLMIVPTAEGYAEGNILIARGEKSDETYQYFNMIHTNKVIQFILVDGDITDQGTELNEVLQEIHIIGNDTLLTANFACAYDKDQQIKQLSVEQAYNKETEQPYLKIYGGDNTIEFDEIDSITYGTFGIDSNMCDKGYYATPKHVSDTKMTYIVQKADTQANDLQLILNLELTNRGALRMSLDGADGHRFKVPESALSPDLKFGPVDNADVKITDYFKISNETDNFRISLHEFQNPDSVYFRIDDESLLFSDYFLSLETQVNTNGKLYGVGERITDFFIKEGIYTSWAMDQTDPEDDGVRPGKNIYGTHPVYFTQSTSGKKSHWGMFNLNANAQDTKIAYKGDLGGQISHYITGTGIFDMYFFLDHATPDLVVKQYHLVIGPSLLPPYWGLGWHQCRYGYNSTDALKQVYEKYSSNNFPMDTLWSDIDHMDKYRDFTFDKNGSYKGLDDFVKNTLHKDNRRYVPIVDAGIAIVRDGSYPTFDEGQKADIFIKSGNPKRYEDSGKNDPINDMQGVLYGKVWPGFAAFPDFTADAADQWWRSSIKGFHDQVEFDGLWLDMNEVSNFCTGACIPEDIVPIEKSVKSKLFYQPGSRDLEEKSLSIDGRHSDGFTELDHHSLFGFRQGISTYNYFTKDMKKKPLIISRSTFAGQGKFTSHWLGDNFSEWKYLKWSISGVMNMNLFGITFTGADICGFLGDTTEKLCQRWTNIGAFYPFARNHNDIATINQEPYRWSTEAQDTMRTALRWRYALLRYFYTQMNDISYHGGMFWQPLFFQFPNESVDGDVERNIMIGPALKLSAMIDESDDATQKFRFPKGLWCDIVTYRCTKFTSASDYALPTTAKDLNLHLRPGHIIPLQRSAVVNRVNTTADLQELPMGLVINIDVDNGNGAFGTFHADDGISYNSQVEQDVEFTLSYDGSYNAVINFNIIHKSYTAKDTKLSVIEFIGADYSYIRSCLKGKINGETDITGTFDSGSKLLRFEFDPIEISTIEKIQFG
eukprot:scpid16282/ scgid19611/ Sucrase-isomaltase, intestinal; Sucrase; Isomaltase